MIAFTLRQSPVVRSRWRRRRRPRRSALTIAMPTNAIVTTRSPRTIAMRKIRSSAPSRDAAAPLGYYVRSLSCRNRRPRAGSGGGPAKRYVRSSTTSTTSSRKALSADPQPARRRRGRSRPHELVPVPAYGRPSSGAPRISGFVSARTLTSISACCKSDSSRTRHRSRALTQAASRTVVMLQTAARSSAGATS